MIEYFQWYKSLFIPDSASHKLFNISGQDQMPVSAVDNLSTCLQDWGKVFGLCSCFLLLN